MSGRHRRGPRRRAAAATIVSLVGLAMVGLFAPGAFGGYIAKVANNTNFARTANTFTSYTCTGVVKGSYTEAGSAALVSYSLGDAASASSAENLVSTSYPGTYYGTPFSKGVANTSPTVVCPRDARTVTTFNGTTNWIGQPLNAPELDEGPFSVEAWFRTSTPAGRIIGWGNDRNSASASNLSDRHLYVGTDGLLYFGVKTSINAQATLSSKTTVVTDGAWHNAIGVLSSTTGLALYLDGTVVDSNSTVKSNYGNHRHLKVGWDRMSDWDNQGTNQYFKGEMAFASAYDFALTSDQVANHYKAGV